MCSLIAKDCRFVFGCLASIEPTDVVSEQQQEGLSSQDHGGFRFVIWFRI